MNNLDTINTMPARSAARRQGGRPRAYTLIEVLVTIALILLLATLTVWVLAKIWSLVKSLAGDTPAARAGIVQTRPSAEVRDAPQGRSDQLT